jgi:predicted thioesterase
MKLEAGLTHTHRKRTVPAESAAALGSGGLEVFSTPSLVALFEIAAKDLVDPLLPEGHSTVGIEIAVKHQKATPIGQEVWCEVLVTAAEGKRITFTGEMFDEQGRIGQGSHTRYVVNDAEFLARLGK